ncbi:hypothetical protein G7Y89_g9003 [Cudoniella acicularis]|uniref:Uncharacterized protein n=1 Tax=Cudoniella acicularis TaxID=354080 RepID=A0A8H4W2B8_9HELO|nr:hypothetical protein G7Y89_g9003 [Cudoniella acicularis]
MAFDWNSDQYPIYNDRVMIVGPAQTKAPRTIVRGETMGRLWKDRRSVKIGRVGFNATYEGATDNQALTVGRADPMTRKLSSTIHMASERLWCGLDDDEEDAMLRTRESDPPKPFTATLLGRAPVAYRSDDDDDIWSSPGRASTRPAPRGTETVSRVTTAESLSCLP